MDVRYYGIGVQLKEGYVFIYEGPNQSLPDLVAKKPSTYLQNCGTVCIYLLDMTGQNSHIKLVSWKDNRWQK